MFAIGTFGSLHLKWPHLWTLSDVDTRKSCPFWAGVLCALAAPPRTVKHYYYFYYCCYFYFYSRGALLTGLPRCEAMMLSWKLQLTSDCTGRPMMRNCVQQGIGEGSW